MTFAPSSPILASPVGPNTNLWRIDGTVLNTLLDSTEASIDVIAISPDESLIAMANNRLRSKSGDEYLPSTLLLWEIADESELQRLEHSFAVQDVAFSPAGDLLASVDSFGAVRIWRVSDGELLRTIEGLITGSNKLSFSPDGSLIMAMASDPSSGTVIRIFGIVFPTIGPPPAPEPTKTPIPIWESLPRPLIYDDFSGEALDSTLWREASWAYPEDAGPTSNLSYQQIDDRLVLEARPVSYLTGLELDATLPNQRTIDQVNAFEARMYLPGGGARPWATAVVKLKARFGDVS